jgi:hypothetical protein
MAVALVALVAVFATALGNPCQLTGPATVDLREINIL